jgi:hypothetical protein
MESCFFNSCILNDNDYLTKYKKKFTNKDGQLTEELFVIVDSNDNIIQSLNIISNLKKQYIFCKEHFKNLQDLIKIKETIISHPDNIPKDTLITLNKILKNNIDIKKLIYNIAFQRNTNITKILLNNLHLTNNKDNKLYILLNLNHLIKENIIKKIDKNLNDDLEGKEEKTFDNELFVAFCKEINDLKLMIYDLNQKKVNSKINDENLFRDVIIYCLCLNNIECLFDKWDKRKDALNLKSTQDLIQNISDIFCQIISAHSAISNKVICNELFYNIIGFINIYLLSDLKNFDLVIYLINLLVKTNQHIYGYINTYKNEEFFKFYIKNYITTLNTILVNMIGISLDELDKDQIDNFLKNSENFNKDKKFELLYYKNNELIGELKGKIQLAALNKNKPKLNIDED